MNDVGDFIETRRKENNISHATSLLPFDNELKGEIAEIQAIFINTGDNIYFVIVAKYNKVQNNNLIKTFILRYGFKNSNLGILSNAWNIISKRNQYTPL